MINLVLLHKYCNYNIHNTHYIYIYVSISIVVGILFPISPPSKLQGFGLGSREALWRGHWGSGRRDVHQCHVVTWWVGHKKGWNPRCLSRFLRTSKIYKIMMIILGCMMCIYILYFNLVWNERTKGRDFRMGAHFRMKQWISSVCGFV